jgi:hypothetical protein
MFQKVRHLPSPALVLSVIALIAALGGGAFALASSDNAKDKKIAKKVTNKLITKRAKTLSVRHAATADNATRASSADNAAKLGGAEASSYQSRVNGSCSGSRAIQSVNANGTVGCGPGTEAWHVVADNPQQNTNPCDAGTPAIFCGVSGGNYWKNFDPTNWETARFYRDPAGTVHVEGLVNFGLPAGNPIFILPPGYRPARNLVFAVECSDSAPQPINGRANVDSDGAVQMDPGASCDPTFHGYLSLSGIEFRAEQ